MSLEDKDVIATWISLDSNTIQLWTMQLVGNFAVCGFAISDSMLTTPERWALTLGFWLFALGNLVLLRQKLQLLDGVKSVLEEANRSSIAMNFARLTHPVRHSIIIHLAIDICVTLLIWRSLFLS